MEIVIISHHVIFDDSALFKENDSSLDIPYLIGKK